MKIHKFFLILISLCSLNSVFAAEFVSNDQGGRFVDKSYFGMHVRFGAERNYMPAANFASWRVITPGTEWRGLQPMPMQWRFEQLDRAVDLAQKKGIDVILTLGQTPTWAAARPNEKVPNGFGASSEPRNMADWEMYIRMVVNRYKGKIAYYELWNEPRFTEVDPYKAVAGFTGSAAQMVQMATIAKRVILQLDPKAKLLSPAIDSSYVGLPRVKQWFKSGGGQVTDIFSYHYYMRPPEKMIDLHRKLKSELKDAGYPDMPIWNTETGYLVENLQRPELAVPIHPGHGFVFSTVLTRSQLAAEMFRAHILLAAAGLDRFYWYSWDIPEMGLTDHFGQTPTYASQAYSTMLRWLNGSVIEYCKTDDDVIWRCALRRDGRVANVYWSLQEGRGLTAPAGITKFEKLDGQFAMVTGGVVKLGIEAVLISNDDKAWLKRND